MERMPLPFPVDRITIDNPPAGTNISVDLNGTGYNCLVKAGDDLVRKVYLRPHGNSVTSVSLLPGGVIELRESRPGQPNCEFQ